MWRLFGFSISEMNPSVYHLQLHLDGQQFVSFKSTANIDTVVNNPMIRKTMLTEFFYMNETNDDAIELNLLYKEFPKHFVWGAFFIDGPGGIGKSCLYRALLATLRSKGFIALATTSSGVAASILPGGRTAHSRFKIPIDIDQNYSCNISKQSSLAYLIQDAKLSVWDEVSMVKSKMFEVFDLLLNDIMGTHELFGGKVVVSGGDFRQTLPVVRNGKKEDFIRESLLYCNIWNRLEKLQLSENMRAKTDPAFVNIL
uniref:ATP-dependent DNA helicase n=1 Tax=Nicotiana sylvestris TaxID=4096 RepID=A0A1U7WGG4_NICSY|nr:PREDICTED: ATP-dependent DNA helicase PIF4-like [Nicotiana sylvestris]